MIPSNSLNKSILEALNNLIEVVKKLRSPQGGCPWDLAQTQETLIPYIIEEAFETVDAIHSKNQREIAEELGDLLLQVILQAQIAQDNNYFTLQEVAQNITDKLIRRHPHVFGDVMVTDTQEINHNWEKIKETEKTPQLLSEKLKGYARSLPPLMASLKISKKAAKTGFEWENAEGVWDKFKEELQEFQEAINTGDKQHAEAELGDLLFTVVNLARWYNIDPTVALQGTNNRFIHRLSLMEKQCDRTLDQYTIEELESLWQKAKQKIKAEKEIRL